MAKIIIVVCVVACALLAVWLWTPDIARDRLEAKYLADPHDLVQVGQWRLHVRDAGPRDAPAVILIHGFGSSLQTWDSWVPELAHTYRVIRFDLPGSGLSLPDPDADYSDARSMSLLLALMDQLGLQRAHLVGHSIGGRIAWTFAATHPDRVDRLILVSPDGFASPGFEYGKAPSVPRMLGLMRWVMPKPMVRMSLMAAYADPEWVNDALLERYDDLLRAPGVRQALLERMRKTVLVDPRPLLARLRAPTLLVWGKRDAMIPFDNSADYLKAVPDVRLASLASAGHLPQEEAAAESLGAVMVFLAH